MTSDDLNAATMIAVGAVAALAFTQTLASTETGEPAYRPAVQGVCAVPELSWKADFAVIRDDGVLMVGPESRHSGWTPGDAGWIGSSGGLRLRPR